MKFDYENVLITGGAGFIGSNLVDRLLSEDCKIKVVDNLSSGRLDNLKRSDKVQFVQMDLKEHDQLLSAVGDADLVFHYAANPEVRVSTQEPIIHFRENLVTTFNLLDAMRINGGEKRLVFASSGSVYGEPVTRTVTEESKLAPVSVYGATKASGEMLVRSYSALFGIKSLALRYANVIGPRLRHGVIYDLTTKLSANPKSLEILGDGKQIRNYVHVDDAITATLLALEKSVGGDAFEVFNVGNYDSLNVQELAEIVIKSMHLPSVHLTYKPMLHGIGWQGDVKRIDLDITKLRTLGFKPKMSSKEAVSSATESILKVREMA